MHPLLKKYCGDCHSPDDSKNHINFLHDKTHDQINKNRGNWKSVIEQLRNRTMPPADDPQPDEEARLKTANWLEKMASLKEGNGTLLDHSFVQWGTAIREGNSHDSHNLPIIVAGKANGKHKTGRRIKFKEDTPLCNLYLNMLHWQGYDDKSFSDSTGTLDRLS